MAEPGLSPLQKRILKVLAMLEPPWTLTGGGALALCYLGDRETRDLDLFFLGLRNLGQAVHVTSERLTGAGLETTTLQTSPSFARLRVTDNIETTIVELVAESVASIEAPRRFTFDGVEILVDTSFEILVNKLTALLSRSEIRDLSDVKRLLEQGLDLEAALDAAPSKDAGFSAMTLAWVLRHLPVAVLGLEAGLEPLRVAALETFRDSLVQRLVALSAPA